MLLRSSSGFNTQLPLTRLSLRKPHLQSHIHFSGCRVQGVQVMQLDGDSRPPIQDLWTHLAVGRVLEFKIQAYRIETDDRKAGTFTLFQSVVLRTHSH